MNQKGDMRAVVYSVKNFEKEFLAKANQKKHDITLISNPLSLETAIYAKGKDAVIVFTNDDVSATVIEKLAELGIKYIATRSVGKDHIDEAAALKHHIKVANVPSYSPEAIAEFTVTLALALSRGLIQTVDQSRKFDFSLENHIGFNFSGKTVGIIGLGKIGLATASIFKGMGCKILGFDLSTPVKASHVKRVGLEILLKESNIISLHIPLTAQNRHLVNEQSIAMMKNGVMLLNTSRGGLLKTEDVLKSVQTGKIGYLGLDVYENEKNLFFCNHQDGIKKDPLLESLLQLPNVIITPHQAFLTFEAIQEIAAQTILSLDLWQKNKPADKVELKILVEK
ncbi:MAG: 2-hydroxyacid dehydrogenase [Flavobacterium sp.]|nr:2-hydroxyacid dehydrogenase [Pedobacter sp.]